MAALVIAVLGILGFNFLQGYYAARLQISVASLFHMDVARLAHRIDRPLVNAFVATAAAMAQRVDAATHYAITAGSDRKVPRLIPLADLMRASVRKR